MLKYCVMVALALAAQTNNSTCGANPKDVKDCDHSDLGSCGNACCKLEVIIGNSDPGQLYADVKNFLMHGGSDGSFTYSNGTDKGGHNPSDDLRKYKIPEGYQYIW